MQKQIPFQRKILKTTTCPRCNAKAELRIERPERADDTELVFIFVVCKICRYRKFVRSSTEKAIKIEVQINEAQERLQNMPVNSSASRNLIAKIENMERAKARLELGF